MKLYLPRNNPVGGVVLPPDIVDGLNGALGVFGPLDKAHTLVSRIQQVSRHLRLDVLGTVRGENGLLVAVDIPKDPDRLFGALGVATHALRRAENLVETNDPELVQRLWERASGRLGLSESSLRPSLVGENILGHDVVERLFGRTFIAGDTPHGEWQTHRDGGRKGENGRGPLFLRARSAEDWAFLARTAVATVTRSGRMSAKELSALMEAGGAGGLPAPTTSEFRELIEQETALAITQGFISTADDIVRVSVGFPQHEGRTGTKITRAQFSTPPAVGFLASRFLGQNAQSVLEPTIGNGTLVASLAARGASITGFELAADRAVRAQHALGQGADVQVGDALQLLDSQATVDAVVANPPFGSIDSTKSVPLGSFGEGAEAFKVSTLDAEIAVRALDKVRPGGSAVLVMPAEIFEPGKIEGQRAKLDILFKRMFKDVETVALDAKLYKSMGANTPVLLHFLRERAQDLLSLGEAVEKSVTNVPVMRAFSELFSWADERFDLQTGTEITGEVSSDDVEEPNEDVSGSGAVETVPFEAETVDDGGELGEQPERRPSVVQAPGRGTGPEAEETSGGSTSVVPEAPETQNSDGDPDDLVLPQWFDSRLDADPFTEPYLPFSNVGEGSVVIQSTLQGPVYSALTEVMEDVGDLDEFAAAKLGLTADELRSRGFLSPEQVDSIALGFHKRDQGEGMIIGDKMGVGKGRQLAAHALSALREGSPVLFTTLDPTLFTDFAGRDLRDVSGRPLSDLIESSLVRPFIFNPGADAALKDPDTGAVVFATPGSERTEAKRSARLAGDVNMLMLTYSQLQTQSGHWRLQTVLNWLEHNAGKSPLLLLDEVHKAAGVESRTGAWMSSIIDKTREVGGNVIYSSATSMKSGKNIVVYSAALPDTGIATKELTDLMESNPLSMQEVLSAEMAAGGRLIEREMPSEAERVIVRLADKGREKMDYAREMTDTASAFLSELVEIAPDIKEAARKEAKARFGGLLLNAQDKTVDVTTTSPVSQFDNYSRYLMLAVKGNFAEELILSSVAKGEKPTAVVDSTADTLTQWIAAQHSDGTIDAHPNIGHVLQRNASRLLEAKIETAMGESIALPMDAYSGWLENFIERVSRHDWSGFRVNVLDKLEEVSTANGLTFRDITRRSLTVQEEDGRFFVKPRDVVDKATAIREFGRGETDVLALNRGAATGLSAHASTAVGPDLRRRSMIAFQFQRDIADQRQVEGRINRFAQVSAPVYYTPSTGFAADERLANLFNRANRNLTSSTSASRENSSTIEGVDLLNPAGDAVVAKWASSNPEVAAQMQINPEGLDLGRKLLGRIVMLSLEDQEAVLSEIDVLFSMHMEKLTREGRNPLRLSRFEWGATVETISTLVEGDSTAKSMAERPVVLNRVRYSEDVHWQSTTSALDRVKETVESRPEVANLADRYSFDRLRNEHGGLNFAHEIFNDARAGGTATSELFRNIDPVLAVPLERSYRLAATPSHKVEGKSRADVAAKLFFQEMRTVESSDADSAVGKAWDAIKQKELSSGEVFRPGRYMAGLERAVDRANFLLQNGAFLTPGAVVGLRMNAVSDFATGEFGRAFRKTESDDAVVPAVILSIRTPEEKMGSFSHWHVTFMTAGSRGAFTASLSSMRSALHEHDNGRNSSPIVPISAFYNQLRVASRTNGVLDAVYGGRWQDIWSELNGSFAKLSRVGVPNLQEPEGFRLFSAINDRVPSGIRWRERHVLEGNLFKALNFVTAKSGRADGEKAIYTDDQGVARHAVVLSEKKLDKVVLHLERHARHAAQTTKVLSSQQKLKAFIEVVHSMFAVGTGKAHATRQEGLLERLFNSLAVIDADVAQKLLAENDGSVHDAFKTLASRLGNQSDDMPVSLSIGGDVWKGAYAPNLGGRRRKNVYVSYPASLEVREPRSWESSPSVIDYRLSVRPIRQAIDTMLSDSLTAFMSHPEIVSVAFRKNNVLKGQKVFDKLVEGSSDRFANEKMPKGVLLKQYDLRSADNLEELVEVLSAASLGQSGEISLSGPAKRLFNAIERLAKAPERETSKEAEVTETNEIRLSTEPAL